MASRGPMEPSETDRRHQAALLGHNHIEWQDADVWVWDDGWVTKRIGSRRRFAWQPEGGAERFLEINPGCRGYDETAFRRI